MVSREDANERAECTYFFNLNCICMFESDALLWLYLLLASPHFPSVVVLRGCLCSVSLAPCSKESCIAARWDTTHKELMPMTCTKGRKKTSPSAAICYAKRICAPRKKHRSLSGFTRARPDGGTERRRFRHTCAFVHASSRSACESWQSWDWIRGELVCWGGVSNIRGQRRGRARRVGRTRALFRWSQSGTSHMSHLIVCLLFRPPTQHLQ